MIVPPCDVEMAEETGIPYRKLINRYLRDCVVSKEYRL